MPTRLLYEEGQITDEKGTRAAIAGAITRLRAIARKDGLKATTQIVRDESNGIWRVDLVANDQADTGDA